MQEVNPKESIPTQLWVGTKTKSIKYWTKYCNTKTQHLTVPQTKTTSHSKLILFNNNSPHP